MSMSEILDALPGLSLAERRELTRQLIALEPEHDDLALCDTAARAGFALLDAMEAQDEPVRDARKRRSLAGGQTRPTTFRLGPDFTLQRRRAARCSGERARPECWFWRPRQNELRKRAGELG
nr:hypothetical protein [Verrucomicrobiota bacterium]